MSENLSEILNKNGYSLVVRNKQGEISTYTKKGVRDLIWLLDNDPERLQGAEVADKIVGKAAAALMINAKVSSIYAEVLSFNAVPFLTDANIPVKFNTLTNNIQIPENDTRCRLEEIVADANTPQQAEALLRKHFDEMKNKNNL